jgi:hypothetical protein
MFSFPKPKNWSSLALFQKIRTYKKFLDERFSPYVDKLNAKKIVTENSSCKVAPIIRTLKSVEDFSEDDLNTNWILKANHGSGWNIPITKITTVEEVKTKLSLWNRTYIGSDEKQYVFIEPKFFLEEKIEDAYVGKTGNAVVFMFRCIHGKAVTIGVKKGDTQNMYFIDGTPITKAFPFVLPFHRIEQMVQYAEELSKPFEFVRMDFYLDVKGDIYFSEYTFSPAGGEPIYQYSIEKQLGALWI